MPERHGEEFERSDLQHALWAAPIYIFVALNLFVGLYFIRAQLHATYAKTYAKISSITAVFMEIDQ